MVCDDTKCLPPTEIELVFNLKEGVISKQSNSSLLIDDKVTNALLYGLDVADLKLSDIKCKDEVKNGSTKIQKGGNSLWNIFGLGFLGGLLALLTPCVFPMIPLTVSFFTKKNGQKKCIWDFQSLIVWVFYFRSLCNFECSFSFVRLCKSRYSQ